ncbi:MAG: cysteine desulfurase family protein [Verrucomicrobiales bacterium]
MPAPALHYFDHNATTPLPVAAREAWLDAQDRFWFNPSSLYREAGVAKRRLEDAREAIADLCGCEPARVVFTGGATEANNAVLRRAAAATGSRKLAISAVEHPSVREPARAFAGDRLTEIPVDGHGVLDLDALGEALARGEIGFASLVAANNETGVLQPWREAAALCRERGVPFHSDAAQWIGKMPPGAIGDCDWVTASAHKFGGPKGIGFLLIPSGTAQPLGIQRGGPQEGGHRAGTEDLPGIAAMVAALNDRQLPGSAAAADRDRFEAALLTALPGTKIVVGTAPRLANTSMAIMPRHSNLKWVTRLGERGFPVSTGSACSSGKENPSHVMAAMGLTFAEMGRVLRFSAGPATTRHAWDALLAAIHDVWQTLESGESARPKLDLGQL